MKTQLVYDCFTFFQELDILEIRLNVLNEVVDKFVIVEMNKTHTGKDKEFIFEKNKERYKDFLDKIIYIKVTDAPNIDDYPHLREFNPNNIDMTQDGGEDSWLLENYQRDQIMKALKNTDDYDIIMISDLDEIPNPNSVKYYKNYCKYGIYILHNLFFSSFFNNLHLFKTESFSNGRIGLYRDLKDPMIIIPYYNTIYYSKYGLPSYFRQLPAPELPYYGWHFSSFFFNKEMKTNKINSISESFGRNEKYANSKKDIFDFNKFVHIPINSSNYPKYILDNKEKYSKLFLPADKYNFYKDCFRIMFFRFFYLIICYILSKIIFIKKKHRKKFKQRYKTLKRLKSLKKVVSKGVLNTF